MASKRALCWLLPSLFMVVLLAGCGASSVAPEPTATSAPPTATPEPQPTDTPAVSANTGEPTAPATQPLTFTIVPAESEAKYSVQEEIFGQTVGFIDTIGATQAIQGSFQLRIDGTQVTLLDNHFVVDLRTLRSNDSRRDARIRREWLESDTYPWAEFRATAIEEWPADAAAGNDVTFKVVGELTIREITQPVTFAMTARLDGATLTGTATADVLMVDYGFEPPNILGMLRVRDGVTITVRFTARS